MINKMEKCNKKYNYIINFQNILKILFFKIHITYVTKSDSRIYLLDNHLAF